MEENVALDSTKQRKFNKSIKGIKKLLKKNEDKPHTPAVLAPKDDENKIQKAKKKRPERGLVYLSHIPHGFYEHEMTQYFKQFGMVTKVRVIRSPRTGRSKGYAFVEFREPAVAEIVAETMNNYLMGKRLIKAAVIPPEKQKHNAVRKFWTTRHNPTADRRIKERKAHNADKTDAEHIKKAKKMLLNLQKTKKKLIDLGINYDFFKPVDVPAALLENVKSESGDKAVKVKKEKVEKQNKKKQTNATEKTKEKKPEIKQQKLLEGKNKKEVKKPQESDKAKQNEKQKKMQAAGVKLPENFIKVAEEEEDSDSSLDFDSDEYEKMLENDSDASSGDETDEEEDEDGESDDEEGESDDEESEEEVPQLVPIKQKKGKKPLVALPPPKQSKVPQPPQPMKAQKPQPKKAQKPQPPQHKGPKSANIAEAKKASPSQQGVKRKNLQPDVSPKKPKFEKKPRNKQFKKKNKV
ncbi:MKI67 FHA domain-interacting nucleolar phosphoprotein-like isoform X2 [Leguminivora glycinivorella]|uniref:MKI67 FHA domain-interacting nucleolar phosphoprotein-like isoform X2 n=1 Tax=Leguminivora glycinivorella TaxID=1035111 RepID=UPI00200D2C4B|nr:MKI67 FHA domain-interacting nucleolar phosphoprotein-like isoform X2 [Leguminivora glycinivorella]